jgi:hypothetical protein
VHSFRLEEIFIRDENEFHTMGTTGYVIKASVQPFENSHSTLVLFVEIEK